MKLSQYYLLLIPLMGLASCCPFICPQETTTDMWLMLSVANESKYARAKEFLETIQVNERNLEAGTNIIRTGTRHEVIIACKKIRIIRSIPTITLDEKDAKKVTGTDVYEDLLTSSQDASCQSSSVGINNSLNLIIEKIRVYINQNNWAETGKKRKLYIFVQVGSGRIDEKEYKKLNELVKQIKIPKELSLSLNIFDIDQPEYLDEVFSPWKESYNKIIGRSEAMKSYLKVFTQSKID